MKSLHVERVGWLLLAGMLIAGVCCCCRALGAGDDGFVSYGKFRNFLILLPEAKLVDRVCAVQPPVLRCAWLCKTAAVDLGIPVISTSGLIQH